MSGSGETRREFVFYLLPEFTLLAFASAVEALRLANAVLGYDAYAWRFVSANGISAEASCGIVLKSDSTIETERLAVGSRDKPFMVVVCGGRNIERYATSKAGEAWLRECRANAVSIASLCTGAHVLAQARLLDDKRCVIHWENFPSFTERFLDTSVRTGLFEIDGAIHTCAGGAASFDMMLHIIRGDFGETVVAGVCDQAIVDRIRSSEDLQRVPFSPRAVKHHPVVVRLIERMQETLSDPMPVEALMANIGLTRRQIERLFRNELGQSPGKFYMKLRLERAKLLLQRTKRPIVEVAIACGFSSASHFSKSYRDAYGASPHETRAQNLAEKSEQDRAKASGA